MNLSDDQFQAFEGIVNRVIDQVKLTRLGGLAGNGKTFLTANIKNVLMTEYDMNIRTAALAGRAAMNLILKGEVDATTIHRLFYKLVGEKEDADTGRMLPVFRKVPPDHFVNSGVNAFFIDEASMVNKKMHDEIMSFGIPVVYVGDYGQLPPIGDDPRIMTQLDYKLVTNHRQNDENDQIVNFAYDVRSGKYWKESKANVHIGFIKDFDDTFVKLIEDNWETTDQFIAPIKAVNLFVNSHIRKIRGFTDPIHVGDNLIGLTNNYSLELFNGSKFTVERIHKKLGDIGYVVDVIDETGRYVDNIIVLTDSLNDQEYDRTLLGRTPNAKIFVDYGYSITCHKAQGSEFDVVTVLRTSLPYSWEQDRWDYTAATRAKRQLNYIFINN